jgi:hypothetical protein
MYLLSDCDCSCGASARFELEGERQGLGADSSPGSPSCHLETLLDVPHPRVTEATCSAFQWSSGCRFIVAPRTCATDDQPTLTRSLYLLPLCTCERGAFGISD